MQLQGYFTIIPINKTLNVKTGYNDAHATTVSKCGKKKNGAGFTGCRHVPVYL